MAIIDPPGIDEVEVHMQEPAGKTDGAAAEVLELFRGSFWADPYPVYGRLRSQAPVHEMDRPDGPVWLLTRHNDVRVTLTDPRLSRD